MDFFAGLNREQRREKIKFLAMQNSQQPKEMTVVPNHEWEHRHHAYPTLRTVWRSRYFLCQGFHEGSADAPVIRLSINRCELDEATGRWKDGITWDELQQIKRECGFGNSEAVEIYPADDDIVNVGNLRHLWIMVDKLPFSWKKK